MIAEHAPLPRKRRREFESDAAGDGEDQGHPTWLTLAEIARVTGIGKLACADVVALFTATASDDARLTRAEFSAVIERIVGAQDTVDFERASSPPSLVQLSCCPTRGVWGLCGLPAHVATLALQAHASWCDGYWAFSTHATPAT